MAERIVILEVETSTDDPRVEQKVYQQLESVLDHAVDHGWLRSGIVETVLEEVDLKRIHP